MYEGPLVLTVAGEKGAGDTGNAGKGNPATRAREPLPSFLVNKQDCPGEVRIYASGEGADLTVVNRVSLEFYVESVLGPKSSPVWPDEAIKAQAVAVRSLAWYEKQRQGERLYAVRSVESGAFYGGGRTVNQAVAAVARTTAGQVLYYQGPRRRPILPKAAAAVRLPLRKPWGTRCRTSRPWRISIRTARATDGKNSSP